MQLELIANAFSILLYSSRQTALLLANTLNAKRERKRERERERVMGEGGGGESLSGPADKSLACSEMVARLVAVSEDRR